MKTKAALELGNYLKGTFTCVCGIVKSFFSSFRTRHFLAKPSTFGIMRNDEEILAVLQSTPSWANQKW